VFLESVSTPARLAFSEASRSLIAATWNDQLVWGSTPTKEFRLTVPGAHRALRFASDGRKLGYAPSTDELGLLEAVTPSVWHAWQMTSAPALLCFSIDISTDGRWVVASAVDGLHLWDTERRAEVASHPVPVKPWWMPAFFGPDASIYYSSATFGVRRVELIHTNALHGQSRIQFGSDQQLSAPRDYMALGLAADGRSVIIGENRRQSMNDRTPPTIWVWPDGNPSAARKLAEAFPTVGYRTIPGSPWAVTTDRIVPDAWIWNFETGGRVRSLGIPVQVNSEPTRNGRWLATRTRQELAVWEIGTWRAISRWPARPDEQDSGDIISSKDSRLLATDTSDGAIVLRELPGGAELMTLTPPRPLAVRHWTFSPDGARLIVLARNGQVVEWDLTELRRELAKMGLDWQ
jgi:WD40 repeat protein